MAEEPRTAPKKLRGNLSAPDWSALKALKVFSAKKPRSEERARSCSGKRDRSFERTEKDMCSQFFLSSY
jgi:hypothetical protein